MSAALNQYIARHGGEYEIDTVAGTVAGTKERDCVRFSGVTLEPSDTLAERIEQAIREAELDGGGLR